MVGVKGQDQGWAIGQIHLIDYNFASNCHRDFKLGSYFSLWKAAPNMTLTLKSSTKVKIFETYQIRKTSQHMVGYYAQGIIYCWEVKGQGQGQAKGQIHLISYNFASNCHRDFKLVYTLIYEKAHQIWPWPWPWKVRPRSKTWKHQGKLAKTCFDIMHKA